MKITPAQKKAIIALLIVFAVGVAKVFGVDLGVAGV